MDGFCWKFPFPVAIAPRKLTFPFSVGSCDKLYREHTTEVSSIDSFSGSSIIDYGYDGYNRMDTVGLKLKSSMRINH